MKRKKKTLNVWVPIEWVWNDLLTWNWQNELVVNPEVCRLKKEAQELSSSGQVIKTRIIIEQYPCKRGKR